MSVLTEGAQGVAATEVAGLDDVLGGGFARRRLFLLEGVPGSGKTTIALQFLIAAARRGESVLYITLSETAEELRAVAASHGWTLDGITIHESIPSEDLLGPDEQYTMFHASEVEFGATLKDLLDVITQSKPTCIVVDSLSELRLLAGNALRFRRQILSLKQFFTARGCTSLLLDDLTTGDHDLLTQSIAHGVLRLEQVYPEYGSERRRLRVLKYRARQFRGGFHDFVVKKGGVTVFPRLVASEHRQPIPATKLACGIAPLDALLGGGIEAGTSTLIVGAAGTGKSTLAAQFAAAAAARRQAAALFVFDENPGTLLSRCAALNIDIASPMAEGRISVRQVDPAELTPGEFIAAIRSQVEEHHAAVVVIDSLNGYLNAMPEERFLTIQLHELLMYLGQKGVATILIGAHQGLIGSHMNTPVDASYLADAVILLRYFEAKGEVRRALSVVKKRTGGHESTIRELQITSGGIRVGEPLRKFQGVLTGVPSYDGSKDTLMEQSDDEQP